MTKSIAVVFAEIINYVRRSCGCKGVKGNMWDVKEVEVKHCETTCHVRFSDRDENAIAK